MLLLPHAVFAGVNCKFVAIHVVNLNATESYGIYFKKLRHGAITSDFSTATMNPQATSEASLKQSGFYGPDATIALINTNNASKSITVNVQQDFCGFSRPTITTSVPLGAELVTVSAVIGELHITINQ